MPFVIFLAFVEYLSISVHGSKSFNWQSIKNMHEQNKQLVEWYLDLNRFPSLFHWMENIIISVSAVYHLLYLHFDFD